MAGIDNMTTVSSAMFTMGRGC